MPVEVIHCNDNLKKLEFTKNKISLSILLNHPVYGADLQAELNLQLGIISI